MRALAGIVALAASAQVLACGHCVEDKIASTYDHAVIQRAAAQKHAVAFFHIEGITPATVSAVSGLRTSVDSAPGVDRGSVRLSLDAAALSVAYDPARVSFARLQRALDRTFGVKGLVLSPLQVTDSPGPLPRRER